MTMRDRWWISAGVGLALAAMPAAAEDAPALKRGECVDTQVQRVGTRLEDTPGSGSAIEYANGLGQVSYDTIRGIDRSRTGDAIHICLVSIPEDCPPGDDRGKIYKATNERTGDTWEAPDSAHVCGGA